jgi:hypothetical protein
MATAVGLRVNGRLLRVREARQSLSLPEGEGEGGGGGDGVPRRLFNGRVRTASLRRSLPACLAACLGRSAPLLEPDQRSAVTTRAL